jgi:hypothetical protein
MWYHGSIDGNSPREIGHATSPDGLTWTKHPGNPILQAGPGSWDGTDTWFPRVIKDGNRSWFLLSFD